MKVRRQPSAHGRIAFAPAHGTALSRGHMAYAGESDSPITPNSTLAKRFALHRGNTRKDGSQADFQPLIFAPTSRDVFANDDRIALRAALSF